EAGLKERLRIHVSMFEKPAVLKRNLDRAKGHIAKARALLEPVRKRALFELEDMPVLFKTLDQLEVAVKAYSVVGRWEDVDKYHRKQAVERSAWFLNKHGVKLTTTKGGIWHRAATIFYGDRPAAMTAS